MFYTFIVIFTIALGAVSAAVVLLILMQRPNADAGMGASLGGGAAESAFGGETGNVLTKLSVRGIVAFFVLTFLLFAANIYNDRSNEKTTATSETPRLGALVESLSAKQPEPVAELPKPPSAE